MRRSHKSDERQSFEQQWLPRIGVRSDNTGRGCVDEVPVIDVTRVVQVHAQNGLARWLIPFRVRVSKQDEREQSLLVPSGPQ